VKKVTPITAVVAFIGLLLPAIASAEVIVPHQAAAPVVPHTVQAPPQAVGSAPQQSSAPAASAAAPAEAPSPSSGRGDHIAPPEPNFQPKIDPPKFDYQDPDCFENMPCVEEWRAYYYDLLAGQQAANLQDPAGASLNDHIAEEQYRDTVNALDARIKELNDGPTSETDGHTSLEAIISGIVVDTFDGHGVLNPSSPSPQDVDQSIGEFFGGLFEQLFPNANYQTINRNIEDPNNNSGGF
jgi:hypothetical protein